MLVTLSRKNYWTDLAGKTPRFPPESTEKPKFGGAAESVCLLLFNVVWDYNMYLSVLLLYLKLYLIMFIYYIYDC